MPLKHGATLVLIGEEIGKDPRAPGAADRRAAHHGLVLGAVDPEPARAVRQASSGTTTRALRLVLFAGEVFPVKHLRALTQLLPEPRYFNLYGPTETNVCTYYEVPPPIPEERTEPFPIGKACSHCARTVVDERGRDGRARARKASCASAGPA